jgi:predicted anti-sigma-YlaC factor YlaD
MDVAGGQLCARARFWVSLGVDEELSELEGALLDAHLARCADCREFALGAEASTNAIRAASYVRHDPIVLHLPRSRSPRRFAAGAGIAAVVAAAAVAGVLVRGTVSSGPSHPSAGRAIAVVASVETPDQLRRLRRTTLLNQRRLPRDISAEPA